MISCCWQLLISSFVRCAACFIRVRGAMSAAPGPASSAFAEPLGPQHILCFGDPKTLKRPCVDCGLVTGRFCDGPKGESGPQCFASEKVPDERWVQNQRTPLCSHCDNKHGKCHFCRGLLWCTPPRWR